MFSEISIEGVAATFLETEEILNDGVAAGLDGDSANAILGMSAHGISIPKLYESIKRTAQMVANHYLAHVNTEIAFVLGDKDARSYFLESLYDYYTGLYKLEELVGVLTRIAIRKCGRLT